MAPKMVKKEQNQNLQSILIRGSDIISNFKLELLFENQNLQFLNSNFPQVCLNPSFTITSTNQQNINLITKKYLNSSKSLHRGLNLESLSGTGFGSTSTSTGTGSAGSTSISTGSAGFGSGSGMNLKHPFDLNPPLNHNHNITEDALNLNLTKFSCGFEIKVTKIQFSSYFSYIQLLYME